VDAETRITINVLDASGKGLSWLSVEGDGLEGARRNNNDIF
jgi:hypothetical protein